MSNPTAGTFSFMPWAREGAATAIQTEDNLARGQSARAKFNVNLQLNSVPVIAPLRFNGPGDVLGFDKRQVVRTEPSPWTQNFEPNYFPAIEFDRPDMPWMFTPLAANGDGKLRPWMVLIVVRKQDGVRLKASSPLPVLEIGSPAVAAQELPNLTESWAWAHVQVAGKIQQGSSLGDYQKLHPERTLSRLLCPRKLAPQTQYYGCVVPAFAVGVKVGLGQEVTQADENNMLPAWVVQGPNPAAIVLPVYHHWEFGTGLVGDFEALVRLLKARGVPASVGYRDMYVGDAGFGLPQVERDKAGAILAMEGALRAPQNDPKPWPDPPRVAFETELTKLLNIPETQVAQSGGDPIVAPPIYGRWHAAQKTIAPAGTGWLRALNLDPRHRAASGLGTIVVQDQQEQLMDSAWEQVGDVLRANRALREAQYGRAVGMSFMHKHITPMAPHQLIATTAPAHARLRMSPVTLHGQMQESALPLSAVSAVFRRIVRSRSPLRRRFPQVISTPRAPAPLLERLNQRSITPRPGRTLPHGAVTPEWVSGTLWGRNAPAGIIPGSGVITVEVVSKAQPPKDFQLPVATEGGGTTYPGGDINPAIAVNFKDATIRHLEATGKLREQKDLPMFPPLAFPQVQATLLDRLDPRVTIPARVNTRIELDQPWSTFADPIEPIMAHPVFPQPMYEPLRDLSSDYLVPGIDQVPANTVTLLETNPRFIEAYMVGLNHEMGRELLWREYPTDQRGSYFRQFWDVKGRIPTPNTDAQIEAAKDIKAIHTWPKASPIGVNTNGSGAGGKLVLLIRGELLRRYPNTIIYAVNAVPSSNVSGRELGDQETYPVFRGTLSPDVTFIGFDLTEAQAKGDGGANLGYYFVLQEPATEPRFGLDVAGEQFGTQANTWSDLSWSHMVIDKTGFDALTHAPATGARPLQAKTPGLATWGTNSAHMAQIALQQPMRVAIHATAMITPEN